MLYLLCSFLSDKMQYLLCCVCPVRLDSQGPASHFLFICMYRYFSHGVITFVWYAIHLCVQEINGCDTFQLGDKSAIFSLTIEGVKMGGITKLTNDILGTYAVTFTNVAGSASVPPTRVTDRGNT